VPTTGVGITVRGDPDGAIVFGLGEAAVPGSHHGETVTREGDPGPAAMPVVDGMAAFSLTHVRESRFAAMP
jgi:hypothetical protein